MPKQTAMDVVNELTHLCRLIAGGELNSAPTLDASALIWQKAFVVIAPFEPAITAIQESATYAYECGFRARTMRYDVTPDSCMLGLWLYRPNDGDNTVKRLLLLEQDTHQ